jgi:PAS domain S-box-containing protein
MAKVLVVEDERIVAWDIQESLQAFGHTVIGNVAAAEEAIQLATEAHPDIVLMDIRLNDLTDGIDAARHIQTHLGIPIIYLTAHADDLTLNQAIATDPFGYLLKPFNRLELHTSIQTALRRYQQERRLFETNQTVTATLNSIGDSMIAVDHTGRVMFMNPAAEGITGWNAGEAIGQPVEEVLRLAYGHNGQAIANPLRQALELQTSVLLPDHTVLRNRHGQEYAIVDSAAPIRNNYGNVVGSVMVFQTLGDRPKPEVEAYRLPPDENLQWSQADDFDATIKPILDRIRSQVDETHILQVAIAELVSLFNGQAGRMALYDLENRVITQQEHYPASLVEPFIWSSSRLLDTDHDTPQIEIQQVLKGVAAQYCRLAAPQVCVLVYPVQDGAEVLGDIWMVQPDPSKPLHASELRAIQHIADACAIALRQAALQRTAQEQVRELEKLNRLKDDFLSTISHELRTPIANIEMATQMLELTLRQMGILNAKQFNSVHRYLQILKDQGRQETNLINDLLDLSLLDSESDPIMPTLIDLQVWLPDILPPFTVRAQSRGIQFIRRIPKKPCIVYTDLLYLERIIEQLLDNACKYTPSGQAIIVAVDDVTTTEITLRITNTGIEIPLQERSRIFEKFYRIPQNDPWQYGGTGLGLALVKKLTERMGTNISLDSQDNQTSFILRFPKPNLEA